MTAAGIDLTGVYGAYFAKGAVENLLAEAQSKASLIDSAVSFDGLQASEITVFEADTACLASSGVGQVMMDLEADILDALQTEFPKYVPLGSDPTGRYWKH